MGAAAHDDALATQPAPPSGVEELAVVPVHGMDELRDLQRTIHRLLRLGICAWPVFFLADFAAATAWGIHDHVFWLVGWRLLGTLLGALAYFTVRDLELSIRQLRLMDAGVFVVGTALLTLVALPFGGIASRLLAGIIVFVFARASLVPSHWRHALAVSLLSALTLPLVMAIATIFDARLRAQWGSRADVLLFVHNLMCVLAAAIIGSVGSHLVWTARKQVYELRKLGVYRLTACIGIGGVGEVWRAWQDPPGREVALKVLRGPTLEDADAVRRFEREARAASRLSHPNTIRVFDFGVTEDGVRYIAMELLRGLNLDAIVRTYGPLPPARAIHLMRQACASLSEAHAKGIVHRDVKPANLFVVRDDGGEDRLKVLDFGLARVLRGQATASSPSPVTPEGIICGTPAFISPEAVSGEGLDARSDVYSLGAVLYFLVTGTVVFPHLSIAESVLAHVGRAPAPPSTRVDGVPRDLERVILRCLEKRSGERYPSVDALERELGACEDAGTWTRRDAHRFWEGVRSDAHSATRRVSP
jgi:serine/threonine-protein kinase